MVVRSSIIIREVDGDEEADEIARLHGGTFEAGVPVVPIYMEHGFWWFAFAERAPIAYAGVCLSTYERDAGYLARVGVLEGWRGLGLQCRLMRAIEQKAKRLGWDAIVSDTTDNLHSANNFIRCGYRIFRPRLRWAYEHSIYWRKALSE